MIKSCATISLVPSLQGGPWIYWDDLKTSCEKAKACGFDAIELFTASADAVQPDELKRCLEQNELTCAAVGTGAGKVLNGLHLVHPDENIRKQAVQFIGEMIDFGAPFGAPAIIGSMQGVADRNVDRDQSFEWLVEGLNPLCKRAADHGVVLIYEPLNRYETNMVNHLEDGVGLAQSLETDSLRLLADLFHMNIEEASISEAFRQNSDYIGHVHFVDSNRRPAGMGHIDLTEVGKVLKEIGYDAYASAEAFAYPNPDAAAEQTIKAFRQFLLPAYQK